MLIFLWDDVKAKVNIHKHGISFEESKSVFFDSNARLIADPEHSLEEERFLILGMSENLNLLIVCHCYLEDENTIRLISARKATKNEVKTYKVFSS